MEKLDKLRKNEEKTFSGEYPTNVSERDEWTLEYINVTRLQAIIEAFDDDASGFITVGEANAFTTSRPKDWRFVLMPYPTLCRSNSFVQPPAVDGLLGSR